MLSRRVLESQHHVVKTFVRASDALEWARRILPEIAILDSRESTMALPVLEELKEISQQMKVLMTTTESPTSLPVQRMKDLGARVFFSSPIDIDVLEQCASALESG
jgi:DNA-binding NtrC family response regulator